MIQYPLHFSTITVSPGGMKTPWSTRSGEFETSLAIPPEFEGPGGGLSPEDLFNQALSNCFVATFKVYAQMSKLDFSSVSADSKLTVDLDENKKPVMKRLDVLVRIHHPSNPERALLLAQKASKAGFILNSVKTECFFQFEIIS
jgi:organic hydroperoxide reductase OsmC/OhrA